MSTKFIMMIGLPASGKSMFAQKIAKEYDALVISSDEVRAEYFGDAEFQGDNKAVFEIVHARVIDNLRHGNNVIYDATNINYKKRMHFLKQIKNINCEKICCLVATPYEDCLMYNAQRERKVPIEVIVRMYKNIYIPQYYEGWDDVQIIHNCDIIFDRRELFKGENGLNFFSQDNSNHELTVGEHCIECAKKVEKLSPEWVADLYEAGLLHDIGKPFVKTFTNSKGEVTDNAHYYQHHMVSAYDSLFYTRRDRSISIANYIQWHMQVYWLDKDETKEKYKQLWGEEFYNNLMILNAADRKAKKRSE